MRTYIISRLLLAIPTLFGVSVVAFLTIHLIPGNIVEVMLGTRTDVTPQQIAELNTLYGLSTPLWQQYLIWAGHIVHADLGFSLRTARAKGLGRARVLAKHALRNALLPVITIVGLQIGYLVGGAVIVENVFTLPGVGRLVVQAIEQRDYQLVQSVVFAVAALVILVNLLVDLSYAWVDPRIRYS